VKIWAPLSEGGVGSLGVAAIVRAAPRALWICRCAWTTLPRRPQLHRANISKHCLMKQKEELRLGRRTSQATSARVVRQCSTVWGTFADVAIPLPIHIAGHIITAEP
jgi:hypothetical protein